MLTWIIEILIVLWLLGYFGPNAFSAFPRTGKVVYVLSVAWSSPLFQTH